MIGNDVTQHDVNLWNWCFVECPPLKLMFCGMPTPEIDIEAKWAFLIVVFNKVAVND
jgi:hypothetical protein